MPDGIKKENILTVSGENAQTKQYAYYPIDVVPGSEKLPFSLKVLLENVLRCASNNKVAQQFVDNIMEAGLSGKQGSEVEFSPARVLFQDFTGVPVFVDFAVMREAAEKMGANPEKINPQIPCDLVIDHSVMADEYGCDHALCANSKLEFKRNIERYQFLKWSQESFENVRIVPPGQGICHQLNIEKLASVVMTSQQRPVSCKNNKSKTTHGCSQGCNENPDTENPDTENLENENLDEMPLAYFDTLVGTDSHTPTANGIGVLGWGVGGIEAEAAALGQPISILVPRVIGIKLTGTLSAHVSGMDVALYFAELLRKEGVVGCFVECFGEGLSSLSATQRSCISNMTPEYGSTCTLFPVDETTIKGLELTGRSAEQCALVESYAKQQGFWGGKDAGERVYSHIIEIDLGNIQKSIAGPSRPHDRIPAKQGKQVFREICSQRSCSFDTEVTVETNGVKHTLTHGALAIAAITSCTTATDPAMMLAAGLLARNAQKAGLNPKPWVKTILAPGSHATTLLLEQSGLTRSLDALGFNVCGFGCMSCIGNSGDIRPEMHAVANTIELASVLSGNRNFEGRISPDVSQNYLADPALVLAYSLAGTMDIDFQCEALGETSSGEKIFLRDIWPSDDEIKQLVERYVDKDLYQQGARGMFEGSSEWQQFGQESSNTFKWDEKSTYIRRAPYFDGMTVEVGAHKPISGAFALAKLGDFITTDHISPAGAIATDSPAALYLEENGVSVKDFNTYGSRRGNHEVMMRGTFANVKLSNELAEGRRGGYTYNMLTNQIEALFNVAMKYQQENIPTIIVAGKMYGSGSSRDWAAKGPYLLGVRAVIAESFERIHRSNLIGMGILPLQFEEGQSAHTLGLDGTERYSIDLGSFGQDVSKTSAHAEGELNDIPSKVHVIAEKSTGTTVSFQAVLRIDTPTEGEYYLHGGILHYVLRNLI